MNKDMAILIPIFNPNIEITSNFLNGLKRSFKNIVLVNDGCGLKYNSFWKEMEKDFIVLKHYKNLGKGRSIKTGINYILNNFSNVKVIVTADCDGQHDKEDILNCGKMASTNPNFLILGVRNFNDKKIPYKSRYGNKITRFMFKLFIGTYISDTQTGLRAMSKDVAYKILDIAGERYEYETRVLIDLLKLNIEIKEVKIKTIYINDNKESHFNPLLDSILIYKIFIKYILSSVSSFFIDIGLFSLFMHFRLSIIISTVIARFISSCYNYFVNYKLVFEKKNKKSLVLYFGLVIIMMMLSAYSVELLSRVLSIPVIVVKIIVDMIIFVLNFFIQRKYIFINKDIT